MGKKRPPWRYRADWELQGELEMWRAMHAEAITESTLRFTSALVEELEYELDERQRQAFKREPAPFNLAAAVKLLKARADIISVFGVRASGQMQDAPRMWRRQVHICCPLHADDTPSLCLYVDQNSWWCFGCQQGGDVISAVMALDGLDFVPAVLKLCQEFGIDVPRSGPPPIYELRRYQREA